MSNKLKTFLWYQFEFIDSTERILNFSNFTIFEKNQLKWNVGRDITNSFSGFQIEKYLRRTILSILSNLCPCLRWWHPRAWRKFETKYWWKFEDFDDQFDETFVILRTNWCWRFYNGDQFVMLVTESSFWWLFLNSCFSMYQICHQNLQIVTNTSSPTSVVNMGVTIAIYTN